MWVDFDLEAARLSSLVRWAVPESDRFQTAAEGDHLPGKRPPEVGRVTTGMETPEIRIQATLGGTDAGCIPDYQGCIHSGYGVPRSGFGIDPIDDVVNPLQSCDPAKAEGRAFEYNRRQAAGLAVPSEIDAEEGGHHRGCGVIPNGMSLHTMSRSQAEHYTWGDACDGWHLVKQESLSVIEERMPPETSEVRHYHRRALQFFYILAGEASMEVDGEVLTLRRGEGLSISAGTPHCIRNASSQAIEFLVISQPKSHGDRIND